jgi:dTDP-4-dehydrorhamnose 3,5-epimerase
MLYTPTALTGAFVIEVQKFEDDRGFFAYAFDAKEAAAHGLNPAVAQMKISYNHHRGTVRGMHWQNPPAAEVKIIRCVRGKIWDVIVDLRPTSPTHLKNFAVELSADNRRCIYVPEKFAHGYQTLSDDAEVLYQVSNFYAPQHEAGLRYNDPMLGIAWPLPVASVSPKDQSWPLLDAAVVSRR